MLCRHMAILVRADEVAETATEPFENARRLKGHVRGSHRSARRSDRGRAGPPRLRRPRTDRHQPAAPGAAGSARGVPGGDTLAVTKLDRLARSLPDARAITDELTARHVRLGLGGSVYDPNDAVGRLLFNVLAMVAEFEADLIRLRTKEG